MIEPTPTPEPAVDLAIIVTGRLTMPGGRAADVSGTLMAPTGEILYEHMSSSLGWLRSDLTNNFGRREALDAKYPQGWNVSIFDFDDVVPDELIAANIAFYKDHG